MRRSREPEAQGVELGMAPCRPSRQGGAQGPHQPVGAGVQEKPELVGGGTGAGRPIGPEMGLPRLDVVFGLAAGAAQLFVERLAGPAGQVGDDERPGGLSSDLRRRRGQETAEGTGCRSPAARLRRGRRCARPGSMTRRRRGIPRAPDLGAAVRVDAGAGALLDGGRPAPQIGVAGEAENEIHASSPAEIEHLGRAVVAVAAQKNFHARPVPAELADQPPQMGCDLRACE